MCKPCAQIFLLLATLALADAFFVPLFSMRKQETPAANNNIGWGRTPGAMAPQSSYKEYPSYSSPVSQLQPLPIATMQQYTYEAPPMMMHPYRQQMQLEPQFHNVQLVPCMCPLTRDVIEQQAQSMMQSLQPAPQQQTSDSTKLGAVPNSNKGT